MKKSLQQIQFLIDSTVDSHNVYLHNKLKEVKKTIALELEEITKTK